MRPATRMPAAGPCTGATAGALLLAAVLLCAACAQRGSGAAPGTTGPATAAADALTVEVDRGDGSPVERYTLTCGDVPGGDHPDPAGSCAHLAGLDDPFAGPRTGVACTEVYGGPQTARVTGTWRAAPVDRAHARTDGCRIAEWDALGPLLPGPVGVGDQLPD
ncbi:Subtilisin inhibitor-like [Geodermatophilus dictyosporus]|uniref:Subtilisin inhibitor-like n=1 Tax=Geodermatophilus dictyosporus TaxID=1523247 RepID=A0A1I5Q2S0_9ACTN|nr:SSI family serine proteinase inhibitor [Geodermatophilus dictyosporus]SFP40156.1 Subtilisin inhibitor-like [Geodermatophilus dictyosporus]